MSGGPADDEVATQASPSRLAVPADEVATQASPSRLAVEADEVATQASPSQLAVQGAAPAPPRNHSVTKPPTVSGGTKTPTSAGTKTPTSAGSTTVGSPLEALERDEILRTHWFCFIGLAISVAGGASVVVLPGDPVAATLLVCAVAIAIVAIAFLYHRTRDPIAFRRPSTVLGWFIPATCVTAAIPYFGAFSPVSLVLVLGVYFVGLGKNWRLSLAVYTVCAGVQALVAGFVIAGWHDTGVVHAVGLGLGVQLVVQALIQVVLLAALVTARMSRGTALLAVGELERAVRLAGQREALLLEARGELERALSSGRGRFSDQTIGGYVLGAVLGRGAMGEVYEAQSEAGPVAVKLLSQTSLGNTNHVLRFLRELRTAAGIEAPNVVKVLAVGEQPVPYLVMERLDGQTLSDLLRARGALPAAEVIDLIEQIGAGITAAAAAGIVHRDLKPQNVFRHGTTWKILDFGVARAMDGGDTLTAGHVVGTPTYMAPEQATGGTVSHATDLYALAAIAYRALTGQPPFAAGEIAETLYRVVHQRPRRPTELADVPPEIDLVLAIGLAKDPARRFPGAHELASALAAGFAGSLPKQVYERGRALEHAGAWAAGRSPASNARQRAPR